MSNRVGPSALMLGLLLVMALGSGAAAQSPSPSPETNQSPEATPLYAPDDMGFTIPGQVGDLTVEIQVLDMETLSAAERETWRDLLLPLGKEPSDAAFAIGIGTGPDGVEVFSLTAVRVKGVPAEVLADSFMNVLLAKAAVRYQLTDEQRAMVSFEDRTIDGRSIKQLTIDGHGAGAYLYPKGEALFILSQSPDVAVPTTPEDVLAELP